MWWMPGRRIVVGPSLYDVDGLRKWFPDRFLAPDYPKNLRAIWEDMYGFVTESGLPLVISETGGNMQCW